MTNNPEISLGLEGINIINYDSLETLKTQLKNTLLNEK